MNTMPSYQKLLDNGWTIQLHRVDDKYCALGISSKMRGKIFDGIFGDSLDSVHIPCNHYVWADSPEEALNNLCSSIFQF